MKNLTKIGTMLLLIGFPVLFSSFLMPSNEGWRGSNRDGKVTGFEVQQNWPGILNKIWQVPVGLGDASPVLADGKLFLHTRRDGSEVALCIEAATGKTVWEKINNPAPEVTGGAASHPGPRSTPAIAGGMVYNVGASGYITCRNAQTGDLIWETDQYTKEVPQFFVSCSPLIADNKCIIHLNGKENGVLVAFDLKTGKEVWKLPGEAATYSSPVVMPKFKDMIVVQGENNLLGVSLESGKLLWKFPTPGETRFYNSSTPVIIDDKIVIAGQGKGTKLIRIQKTGTEYLAEELWNNTDFGVSFNTPVFRDGLIFGNEARFGYLFCLDAQNGITQWADTTKLNRFASILDLGAAMVSLPATGNLIFFSPGRNKFESLMAYKVADTDVYAHPVFKNKHIFIKDKEHLTCWELK